MRTKVKNTGASSHRCFLYINLYDCEVSLLEAIRKLKKYEPTKFMDTKSKYSKLHADSAVCFVNCLNHTKGEWYVQPFKLIDWQEQIMRDVFGVLKPNGYRQFNTAYIEISKKQGKSELAAAVALYLTCGDFEHGGEIYGCASDRQQASIVFDVAVDMVEQCPSLKSRIKPVLSQKRLIYKPLNSFYQVLSAEAYTKHGLNVHGVVFDELHAQPNRNLYDVMLHGSGDARKRVLTDETSFPLQDFVLPIRRHSLFFLCLPLFLLRDLPLSTHFHLSNRHRKALHK